jgi:recombination protein RecA
MPAALRLLDPVLDPVRDRLCARLLPGRLVELSGPAEGGGGTARTSTALAVLRHAQANGETTAWIQPRDGTLFTPDLQDAGLDLEALVVVHVGTLPLLHGLCKAAELLLRSGALGLVVVDLTAIAELGEARGTATTAVAAWLGRMQGLARQHDSRVLLLTEKPTHADSLGTLVSVRIESRRHREPHTPSGSPVDFVVEHQVIKNKSGAPFDVVFDRYRSPDGLGH